MAQFAAEVQARLKRELPALSDQFGVDSLGLFGSVARNEHRPDSDVDLLVTFRTTPGLFTFIELEHHLSDLLGMKVDLVLRDALKPQIGKHVLADVLPVCHPIHQSSW